MRCRDGPTSGPQDISSRSSDASCLPSHLEGVLPGPSGKWGFQSLLSLSSLLQRWGQRRTDGVKQDLGELERGSCAWGGEVTVNNLEVELPGRKGCGGEGRGGRLQGRRPVGPGEENPGCVFSPGDSPAPAPGPGSSSARFPFVHPPWPPVTRHCTGERTVLCSPPFLSVLLLPPSCPAPALPGGALQLRSASGGRGVECRGTKRPTLPRSGSRRRAAPGRRPRAGRSPAPRGALRSHVSVVLHLPGRRAPEEVLCRPLLRGHPGQGPAHEGSPTFLPAPAPHGSLWAPVGSCGHVAGWEGVMLSVSLSPIFSLVSHICHLPLLLFSLSHLISSSLGP